MQKSSLVRLTVLCSMAALASATHAAAVVDGTIIAPPPPSPPHVMPQSADDSLVDRTVVAPPPPSPPVPQSAPERPDIAKAPTPDELNR